MTIRVAINWLPPELTRPRSSVRAAMLAAAILAATGCQSIRPAGFCRQDVIHAREQAQQGLDAVHRGEFDQAEDYFRDAIEHCGTDPTTRYQLANCLWQRGARLEAIQHLTDAIQMAGGEDVDMLVELGYMHANVGNLDQAVTIAEQAMQRAPHHATVWQLHGDALLEKGKHREALVSFQRSLTYAPDDARVLLSTAEIHQQLDRPNRVVATINHVTDLVSLQNLPERAFVMKSTALQQLDRPEEAADVLLAASRRNQLGPKGLCHLAEVQLDAQRTLEAEETLSRVADLQDRGVRQRISELQNRLTMQASRTIR